MLPNIVFNFYDYILLLIIMIVRIISIKVFGTASCRYFQIKFKKYVQLETYFVY